MEDTSTPQVLVVEDDAELSSLVKDYLQEQGFSVTVEPRGDRAAKLICDTTPHLVILDINLPGMDGLAVCRQVRPSYAGPILMLTAHDTEVDEVVGLEVGADDYLAKPVRPRVLLARIRALLRRTHAPRHATRRVNVGGLVVDAGRRSVTMDEQTVELTSAEFDLLWLLASHVGESLTRDAMYQALRGIDHDGIDRSIDLRVSHLRNKLGERGGALIKSVRGVGYQMASAE